MATIISFEECFRLKQINNLTKSQSTITGDPKSEEWIIVGHPKCDYNEIKTRNSLTDVLDSSEYLNVSFEILEYIVDLHNKNLRQ